jgi:hypothetical protein
MRVKVVGTFDEAGCVRGLAQRRKGRNQIDYDYEVDDADESAGYCCA